MVKRAEGGALSHKRRTVCEKVIDGTNNKLLKGEVVEER